MRCAFAPAALGVALACASTGNQTGASERPAPRPSATARAAAGPGAAAPETAAGASRPMTAAEAAEKAHEEWSRSRAGGAGTGQKDAPGAQQQGSGADDAPCAIDDDCTLTRMAPGSCCSSLCSPRAVTRARAKELEQRGAECRGCIEPLCRDRGRVAPACAAGRCVATPVASPD